VDIATSFDSIAPAYDAGRPSFPEELIRDILSTARMVPGERILELGSGTGKATQLFADMGFAVDALEPGRNMVEVARRRLGARANICHLASDFESYNFAGRQYRLVAAAQSFHWFADEAAFVKIASLLTGDGVAAIFANVPALEAWVPASVSELARAFDVPDLRSEFDRWYEAGEGFDRTLAGQQALRKIGYRSYRWTMDLGEGIFEPLLVSWFHDRVAPERFRELAGRLRRLCEREPSPPPLAFTAHLHLLAGRA
jgi:SAM-dependent methyltransferase